ncbi:secoisolariciresinol dehydrogenase-like [Cucumis sativus]|uniref:secoisolariciresinol dehydrogenase-like n=1 Tax=Cucumis sativus TaxID=3659 RepID=UPI0012F5081D|nr:secoisolariciresinol dehydrogenase-like [Cucumis sativus]
MPNLCNNTTKYSFKIEFDIFVNILIWPFSTIILINYPLLSNSSIIYLLSLSKRSRNDNNKAKELKEKVDVITGGKAGSANALQNSLLTIAAIQDDLGHASYATVLGWTNSFYVHCDVTDESQVQDAVEAAVKTFGKLDIMMNNAGIAGPIKPGIIDNDVHDFERVLSVKVTSVFFGIKHAVQAMIPAKTSLIISTGNVASNMGGAASHAYTCSKHAVVGLMKNAAGELGQFGIRVNCLSSYGLMTGMVRKLDEMQVEMIIPTSK